MKRSGIKRSTYRTLRSDEPDPAVEPLRYATSDGRWVLRWKVAPRTYVERVVRNDDGTPARARPVVAKRIDHTAAAARYRAGDSLPTIARSLGCTTGQLSRALRAAGVDMRTPADYGRPLDADAVVVRYRAGDGAKAIARDLGVAVRRINETLVRAGVKLRTTGAVKGRGRGNDGGVSYQTEFEAMKPIVRARSRGRCEAMVSARCGGRGTNVHHRRLRAQGGTNDLDNLLDVCIWCHSHIHANPTQSYELGLMLRSTPIQPGGTTR